MSPQFPPIPSGGHTRTSATTRASRRQFLSGSVAAAAGLGSILMPATALADYHQPIKFELAGEHEWTDEYDRLAIIRKAMWIIDRRFLDVENVVQNVLDLPTSRNGHSFQPGAWSNLQPHYPALRNGDQLLWYQLLTIRKWMSPPNPRSTPKLFIHSAYNNKDAFAWAPYNTVTVEGDGEKYEVSGHFKVYINFRYLGGKGLDSDPWTWASTIAHEMLHNLGHMHPEQTSDTRYSRRQINAFTAALYYGNRKYRFGMRTPDVRCGGREP
jgi:hypothetical protein